MFISPKFKLLFIHIPKTAGCSIEQMIKRQDRKAFETKYKHDSIINNKETIEKYSDYYKFVVVRNSWRICASAYRFACEGVQFKKKPYTFLEWFDIKKKNKHPNHHPFPYQLNYFREGNKIIVDKICKYKTLEKDLKEVCKINGLNFELGHKAHYYGKYNWKKYYSNPLNYKKVLEECKEDIEYFNWKFE